MSVIRPYPRIAVAFAATIAANIVGAIVALSTNMVGIAHAIVSGSPLSAPVPFVLVQGLFVLAAVRASRRSTAVATAATVALLGLVSIVSGFGDGSYVKAGLTLADHCVQAVLVALIAVLVAAACDQTVRALRSHAREIKPFA